MLWFFLSRHDSRQWPKTMDFGNHVVTKLRDRELTWWNNKKQVNQWCDQSCAAYRFRQTKISGGIRP